MVDQWGEDVYGEYIFRDGAFHNHYVDHVVRYRDRRTADAIRDHLNENGVPR